jgi:RES domain-containing protein
MLIVWRLTTVRFARSAFSGDGARMYGGRWHRRGVLLVYTASSQSLAMLEMLVPDEPLRARYVMIEARIPKAVRIERIWIEDLPSNWRDIAARETPQVIGTEWAKKRSSAVLAVPSAIVTAETNYLLNPLHPEFRRIKTGTPVRFETDLRLIKRIQRRAPSSTRP